jgi:hypothetical protein
MLYIIAAPPFKVNLFIEKVKTFCNGLERQVLAYNYCQMTKKI